MMLAIFSVLFLGLALGWLGRRPLAIASMGLCLGLSVWLFLWEIYSPEYGFRMPWIEVRLDPVPSGERQV